MARNKIPKTRKVPAMALGTEFQSTVSEQTKWRGAREKGKEEDATHQNPTLLPFQSCKPAPVEVRPVWTETRVTVPIWTAAPAKER
jgi:hypothetical protein